MVHSKEELDQPEKIRQGAAGMVKGPERTVGKTDLYKSDCYKKDRKEGEISAIYIKQLLQDCSLDPSRTGQDAGHVLKDTQGKRLIHPGKKKPVHTYIYKHRKHLMLRTGEHCNQLPGRIYSITCSLHHQQIAKNRRDSCLSGLAWRHPALPWQQTRWFLTLPPTLLCHSPV